MPIFHFSLIGTLGWAIIPFFAVMMLFGWAIGADHRRPGPAPGPGCRKPGLGRDLLHPALLGRLLPGRHPAASVRWIAYLLPSAPVFEGMRAVLVEHRFDGALFAQAVAVLLVWLVVGGMAFTLLFQSARRRGLLLQSGE